jgi:hypothetical protein
MAAPRSARVILSPGQGHYAGVLRPTLVPDWPHVTADRSLKNEERPKSAESAHDFNGLTVAGSAPDARNGHPF